MTIEELLQAATESCQAAVAAMDIEDAMECAAVAQACAQAAQAMILREMTTTRIYTADAGIRWLRVDTGD